MITISNLNFAYSKKKSLFDNLSLSLSHGRIYGLLGKNGTGKTTLLNLMAGMLFPKTGKLDVMGKIPSKRQVEFLQEVFLVPEEFYTPDVTPEEYAELYSSFYPHFNKEQYYHYLKELEVELDHQLNKMSMGQRKKAFIAFALACNTRILLMDEPTNGLDIPSKTQFRRLLASIVTEERCLLISTHQVRDLDNLIDTVVVLDNHQIIFNQTIDTVADKLMFKAYNESEKPTGILYDEPGVLDGKAILRNESGKPSKIDMELLFNAIVSDKETIVDLFTHSNK